MLISQRLKSKWVFGDDKYLSLRPLAVCTTLWRLRRHLWLLLTWLKLLLVRVIWWIWWIGVRAIASLLHCRISRVSIAAAATAAVLRRSPSGRRSIALVAVLWVLVGRVIVSRIATTALHGTWGIVASTAAETWIAARTGICLVRGLVDANSATVELYIVHGRNGSFSLSL